MSPLKSLHLYSRTPSDLQTSTNFGGVLSIVTMSIMGALLYANLRELLIPTLERSVMIDATYDQPYALDFNLTLVHLPCAYATVNLADAMGQSIHNLTGLRKMRLDATSWEPPYHKLPATSQPSALLAHATVGSGDDDDEDDDDDDDEDDDDDDDDEDDDDDDDSVEEDRRAMKARGRLQSIGLRDYEATVKKWTVAVVLYGSKRCPYSSRARSTLVKVRKLIDAVGLGDTVELFEADCDGALPKSDHFDGAFPSHSAYSRTAAGVHGAEMLADHQARREMERAEKRHAVDVCRAHNVLAFPTVRVVLSGKTKDYMNWIGPLHPISILSQARDLHSHLRNRPFTPVTHTRSPSSRSSSPSSRASTATASPA